MCGIIGFLDKRSAAAPVGRTMLTMLQALSCRGPDSAGLALFGPPGEWLVRVSAPADVGSEAAIQALREAGLTVRRQYKNGVYDALPRSTTDAATIEQEIQTCLPGAEVICLGRQLSLF